MEKKEFEKFKLFFSSLTSRKCAFYYFGIYEGIIIGTNGDTTEKNKKLIEYASPDLSLHKIKFKDPTYYDSLVEFLKIPQGKVVRIRAKDICSCLSKVLEKNYSILWDYDELFCRIEEEQTLIGDVCKDFLVVISIDNRMHEMEELETNDKKLPMYEIDILENNTDNSKVFSKRITMDGMTFNAILYDGIDTVSKEYIKKAKKNKFTYIIRYWTDPKTHKVEFISVYDDDDVIVKTLRPYFKVINLTYKGGLQNGKKQ